MQKIDKNQQFYAYYDTIEETGEVIYCGKGSETRSDIVRSTKRNKLYNDYTKDKKIIRTRIPTLDEDLALKLEDWLIEHYHTWIDDPQHGLHACNIDGPSTNGGSRKHAKSSNLLQSKSMKGRKSFKKGKTHIEIYGETKAKEISEKIKNTLIKNNEQQIKGKTNVEIYGLEKAQKISEKLSKIFKGKKQSKQSSKKGKRNIELYGLEKAQKISEKISKFLTGRPLHENFIRGFVEANSKQVVQIDVITNDIIAQYKSITEASTQTKICGNSISLCCREKKLKTAGGFKWKFVDKLN